MAYGVDKRLIDTYGEIVFTLSLNRQRRAGDPVRALDFEAIEAGRADMGLSDDEIAARIGLAPEQVRYIRVVVERRRYRGDQYRKLFGLGGGRRWREERYTDPGRKFEIGADAERLREALNFAPDRVTSYIEAGWWTGDTLPLWLARQAALAPDRLAIVSQDGATISYRDLAERVDRLAGGLARLGIGRGDVVAVQLPNDTEFVMAYLAIAALGAVMQTLHMSYRERDIESLLAHSRARCVICLDVAGDFRPARALLGLASKLPALDRVIAVGKAPKGAVDFAALAGGEGLDANHPAPAAADPFLLLYTSGTTASPKGVVLTPQNMLSNGRISAGMFEIGENDILLSAAPFTHLYGLFSLHLSLWAGAANLLLPAFAPDALAALVTQARPTGLILAPAHAVALRAAGLLTKDDFASVRLAVFSGAACPPDLMREVDASLVNGRVIQVWGMTELQNGCCTRLDGDAAAGAGRAVPGNEVRVVGEDGAALPAGAEGELEVRGCSVFGGYLDNDQANRESFTADGWFRSGDLALLDKAGNLRLTGRGKDLINRGGVKFNPAEIEALLGAHPDILQVALVAVPDDRLGERACCFAVTAPGAKPTLADLQAFLKSKKIAKTKWPERLELVTEMPLTPTRKIIKGRLAATLGGSG